MGAAVTNRPVFDLFYTLKIGPYSDLAGWSFQRFVREHAEIIALIMLVIFLVLTYTTTLSILVRRRTRALRDALDQRDRIEAEAAQSRQHIANLERTGIVGQMSTIIAHELKQPLGAITNYGNGLLRRLGCGDVEREKLELALREIVLQAERASKIVERVRSYAKHDYPPRKVSDLSIIIENAIQTFRRSRTTDAELTVRMHPHSMAEVDGWEIELVVLNLLKNAADAISGIPDPKIEVCLYPSDEHTWILTVGDNGPYISDEQLSRFFKPLQTSKGEAGMGLGLSIVANIAERHAGNITVARNGSRGVKFTMTIPSQMKDVSVIADMGPETVSIYESGGNGRVAREVVERRGEEQADESPQLERSLPGHGHTGTPQRCGPPDAGRRHAPHGPPAPARHPRQQGLIEGLSRGCGTGRIRLPASRTEFTGVFFNMKRPAFLSGFLMMLVGLGLTIAVMFVLPFHKDAAAPCFYLVRMTAVLGFASALAGVMLQFSSAGLAAGIQLMNMLLGIVITLAAAFVIGPCAVENAPCAETTAPVVMIWGAVIAFLSAADALRLSKRRSE